MAEQNDSSVGVNYAQMIQSSINSKNAVKTSLINKGVEVATQPFSEYAALVDSIDTAQNCPVAEGEEVLPYVWADHRPPEWLALPPNENGVQKITCLFAIFENSTRAGWVSIAGDYTVDWGDGNIENYASGQPASHDYDYSDANLTDSVDALGYKQILVTITPQAGQDFTEVKLGSTDATSVNIRDIGYLLETYINGDSISRINIGGNVLPRRETISIEVGEHAITDARSMLSNMDRLKNVVFDFTNVTRLEYLAAHSASLEYLNINAPLITSLFQVAYGCESLRRLDYSSKLVASYYHAFRWDRNLLAVNSDQKGVFNLDSSNASITTMEYALEETKSEVVNISNLQSDAAAKLSAAFSDTPLVSLNIQNTIKSGHLVSMCYACRSLKDGEFNIEMLPNTYAANLFKLTSLEEVPEWFNFEMPRQMDAAFEGSRIKRIDGFSNSRYLSMRRFAQNARSLETLGGITLADRGGDWRELIKGARNLVEIGAIDVSKWQMYNATDFANLTKLSKVDLFNIDRSISFQNANLSATELNKIFGNLVEATEERIITITGCTGAATCDLSIAQDKGWTVLQ